MADAAADIERRGVSQTAKDLLSGAAGGIAQVLIGELDYNFFLYHRISSLYGFGHVVQTKRVMRGAFVSIRKGVYYYAARNCYYQF